jgi:translocation and assembly module TamA
LARARVGTTLKDELALLPASVRFFAGGDRSVRGYGFENLGPLDANGDVIGGSHLLETSIEIERLVRDQWAVAAFVDRGSAFSGSDPDFSTGVGLGLRWFSPVGPVRLDLAHPLDDADRNLRIHISLGLDL